MWEAFKTTGKQEKRPQGKYSQHTCTGSTMCGPLFGGSTVLFFFRFWSAPLAIKIFKILSFFKIHFQSKIPGVYRERTSQVHKTPSTREWLRWVFAFDMWRKMKFSLWHRRTSVTLRLHTFAKYWRLFQEYLPDITLAFRSSWFCVFAQIHGDIAV